MNRIALSHPEAIYYEDYGLAFSSCDLSTYYSLYFLMGDYWYEIPPSAFIFKLSNDECVIGFGEFFYEDYFLFGDTFLREFFSIYDEENNRMGLVPSTYSTATITAGTPPSTVLEPDAEELNISGSGGSSSITEDVWSSVWLNMTAVGGTFGLITVLLYFIYVYPFA